MALSSLDRSAGVGDTSLPAPESSLAASTLSLECFELKQGRKRKSKKKDEGIYRHTHG
jgi:hypothetical protein